MPLSSDDMSRIEGEVAALCNELRRVSQERDRAERNFRDLQVIAKSRYAEIDRLNEVIESLTGKPPQDPTADEVTLDPGFGARIEKMRAKEDPMALEPLGPLPSRTWPG